MENDDFKEMLSALRDAEAEFLVVGAHALAAQGFVRATGDLDIWVRPTPDNARRVAKAFEAFGGAPLSVFGVSEEDLASPGVGIAIGAEPVRIDLHTNIAGLDYADADADAMRTTLFAIPVRVLSHRALIAAKRASLAKRPEGSPKSAQDAADLAWLESRAPKKSR